jgi:hypothetical protein
MRVDLKTLLDKLGVGYVMSPYETCPWSAYDGEKGITCSAEVRINNLDFLQTSCRRPMVTNFVAHSQYR